MINETSPRQRRRTLPPDFSQISDLDSLLEVLHIASHRWDILLVGDGSGNTWANPCGWSTTLIQASTFNRLVFHGGFSHGTNNVAEMMAYLQPLLYLVQSGSELLRPEGTRVHILTDSEYIVNGVECLHVTHGNKELWRAILSTERYGVKLQAHWIPRATVALNILADKYAGLSRLSQVEIRNQLATESLSEINP